ncbi:NADPH:quinone oxidoreductase family protein [Lentzea tibetensis]|uniref:NADPH:quinone oxidoreductase family protein n=1 Tax=Lentzea tibetensis TaxID=2591470 RepID=A0A563EM18_9PSEU|nr:NADPH:quinone oxidoreductase family protein [Lentzea tibetensis]TWP48197.1 NADPH:quinone oxidoreductase family protein [Lentzea tibetensis]
MRAIQITEFGGPEVLQQVELPDPVPGPGEVLIDVSRAGLNYADTHQAENSYLSSYTVPLVPGGEVVGTTADGRRVVALTPGTGGYAEKAVAPTLTTFDVPEGVDDLTALSLIVQGATAWLLLRKSAHLEAGESVVVHAAAGGVGTIAVQLAKLWGAGRVIATASSDDKRKLALDLGADVAIDSRSTDMTADLIEANGGRRVDIVLDMTGGATTDQSIVALAPFGRLAFYGMASRERPKAIELGNLLSHSTTVAGMWLPHALRVRDAAHGTLAHRAMAELFQLVLEGKVKAIPGGEYGMGEIRQAHEDLRSRRTQGKLLLDPSR